MLAFISVLLLLATLFSMETPDTNSFLNQYVTARLPQIAPGIFEGAKDEPYFTVDQRYIPPGVQTAMA